MKNTLSMNKKILFWFIFATLIAGLSLAINTQNAEAAPPIACPLSTSKNGDVLVTFNDNKVFVASDANLWQRNYSVNIPAGKYNIKMVTWDNHSGHPGQNQQNEKLYFKLYNSSNTELLRTANTQDIPDNVNSITSTIATNANISQRATRLTMIHPAYPSRNPESLYPICALFEKIVEQAPAFQASCSVSQTSITTGQSVTYTGSASGGTGSYTYSWSGSVSGTGQTRTVTYSTTGTKNVTLTVRSGNQTATAECPSVVVNAPEIPAFQASCSVSRTFINNGQQVTYTGSASGGTGSYTYSWSGSVSGTGQTRTVTYSTTGTKNVTLTVRSGNQTATAECPSVVVDREINNDNFSISCEVNNTSIRAGERVTYSVNIRGGRSPYEYRWRGDIENEDDDQSRLRVRYEDAGRYNVRVTVTDRDGNRASDDCPSVRVRDSGTTISETPSGTLASLDSVFLSQVPYTGPKEDAMKVLGFIVLTMLWSIPIGIVFYNRHKKRIQSMKIAQFKQMNRR